ncbi:MAG: glycerol kinase GlpK [Clostridia bacterium]|nr:glycerol kinase GlpK [Clostridia bacterium]
MKDKKYILSLDEGTTSARAILFDRAGRVVATAQREFPQYYPKPGWVEHDAMQIYASQYATMTEAVAMSGIKPSQIACIGITNQRETTVVWDRRTGRPVCPAIVWQCRRTAPYCEQLAASGYTEFIRERTGLLIDAYFSGTKIRWILDNVEGAREKAQAGELLFGTIDTWLIWKLTDGRVHVTDQTNASRTMLFNLHTGRWDEDILKLLGIPACMLPRVCSSGEIYGKAEVMGAEIPISGIAGDQQAALFGQQCFEPGEAKNTYGTGCFLLMHTGEKPFLSSHGLLTTMAATEHGMPRAFALEGSVFVGGAVVQWLRDELGLIMEADDTEYFANKAKDSGGVYVVPAFSGLGAPFWDMHARGTIVGLTRGSGKNQIIRASLESIAYQTQDIMQAMEQDTGYAIRRLKVDGGASRNRFLMQFQADISGVEVVRPENPEATALGAAYLAGLGCGFFASRDELRDAAADSFVHFVPGLEEETRKQKLRGWRRAIRCATAWSKEEDDG